MLFKDVLSQLLERRDLTQEVMLDVMHQVMGGGLSHAQIAAFLIALALNNSSIALAVLAARWRSLVYKTSNCKLIFLRASAICAACAKPLVFKSISV